MGEGEKEGEAGAKEQDTTPRLGQAGDGGGGGEGEGQEDDDDGDERGQRQTRRAVANAGRDPASPIATRRATTRPRQVGVGVGVGL